MDMTFIDSYGSLHDSQGRYAPKVKSESGVSTLPRPADAEGAIYAMEYRFAEIVMGGGPPEYHAVQVRRVVTEVVPTAEDALYDLEPQIAGLAMHEGPPEYRALLIRRAVLDELHARGIG